MQRPSRARSGARIAVALVAGVLGAAVVSLAQSDHPPPDAEGAFDIAVAADGSIWVVGLTTSDDFPLRHPWQAAHAGGEDAFVVRLRPGGRRLAFATYLGGSDDDRALGVAVDAEGNAYVSGRTRSADFPVRRALQPLHGGGGDAFLTKLSPEGRVVYSTYLGGEGDEGMSFVAVDGQGRPTLAGVTRSASPGSSRSRGAAASGDAFVARLSRSGRRLEYFTRLGGAGFDGAADVVVNADGDAWIVGRTTSPRLEGELGTTAPGTTEAAGAGATAATDDAFVASVARSGAVRWTRRLRGSGQEVGTSLARGPDGEIWAMGRTTSADFPVVDPFQARFGGDYDVWVARLSPDGTVELASYLGGPDIDFGLLLGNAIVVDGDGRATLVGKTDGPDFPTRHALQDTSGGGYDVWVGRIDPTADRLLLSTFIGGSGHEFGLAVALDARGRAWLAGKTGSADLPVRRALQPGLAGDYDAWVGRLGRGGRRLTLSTYVGGSE